MTSKESNLNDNFDARLEIYDEIVGIYADLRTFLFALEYQAEMDQQEREGIPSTGIRIADRLEVFVEKCCPIVGTAFAPAP
ncbi:MAG: hypothetical protein R3A50_04755 [Saprospiraceae bacterium]